ncbi:hypothetical protein A3I95_03460 [Candidatus Nomurabacteria bacterium RIFCSPLOWO2_02_FULL_44_12]|uniref:DUF5652 domain-containing protein n=1 Tax=Candidatus Nomurabacteria bacterium RIFCSPLOWO2_12_FULL_44_11 TaxID=1801796 RepID=A0A1F6Y724_9BACT|nr:MAG: hypothetical protein A3E95_00900 [Candidatus Nomurabacteria bacterium RIFCSPHIGHO2_12_FULL_44_22b]OGJ02171.1 MAG: hypothetical protein A3G53_02150 [Candidatus Nomurabacteria bacterium RIFCSPLOWO2_12_FULL_44_11]OGJ07653.1 MAG: hypothetical protein A3I95_03460 [Candidatus Nomurabacteria bacterium RIFCSPLOWO2_02_FULL_44_12]
MNYIFGQSWSGPYVFGIILIMIWSLFWKGLALWHASKRSDKKWFIAILILNTFGVLEIIYLFHFVKIKWGELW